MVSGTIKASNSKVFCMRFLATLGPYVENGIEPNAFSLNIAECIEMITDAVSTDKEYLLFVPGNTDIAKLHILHSRTPNQNDFICLVNEKGMLFEYDGKQLATILVEYINGTLPRL